MHCTVRPGWTPRFNVAGKKPQLVPARVIQGSTQSEVVNQTFYALVECKHVHQPHEYGGGLHSPNVILVYS